METIKKYFNNLSKKQISQLSQLKELYEYWNERINVISRKDIKNLYLHHILHSLSIAKFVEFSDNTSILDVGTGGGFPGIPLAIIFPEVKFYLADSIAKKIKVVNAVSNELKLDNVFANQIRAEEIDDQFDFVVSRAVTELPKFVNWVKNSIRKENINNIHNGILYLKGGDVDSEIKMYKSKISVHKISDFIDEPYFETKKIIYLPI